MEQHSIEWYKARLGKITGSMVYTLMGKPRSKTETFTDTAKNYLYQLAAERSLNDLYAGQDFDQWLQRINVETWAMRYGTDTEALARDNYYMQLADGLTVKECGFFKHYRLDCYGDSPDGTIYDAKGELVGVLEIKCPNPNTFMRYKALFAQGLTLKDIEEKYYWQVQSHIMCTGTDWCDFVAFDKMLREPLQVHRIERCDEDIALMEERIEEADKFIENIVNNT